MCYSKGEDPLGGVDVNDSLLPTLSLHSRDSRCPPGRTEGLYVEEGDFGLGRWTGETAGTVGSGPSLRRPVIVPLVTTRDLPNGNWT